MVAAFPEAGTEPETLRFPHPLIAELATERVRRILQYLFDSGHIRPS